MSNKELAELLQDAALAVVANDKAAAARRARRLAGFREYTGEVVKPKQRGRKGKKSGFQTLRAAALAVHHAPEQLKVAATVSFGRHKIGPKSFAKLPPFP
jgi:hypothetical protein